MLCQVLHSEFTRNRSFASKISSVNNLVQVNIGVLALFECVQDDYRLGLNVVHCETRSSTS
jgi:hypothetical protein